MTSRTRKLTGTLVLFAFLGCYALLAMLVAVTLQVQNASKLVEFLYYGIAGLLWVLPAGILIKWMQKSGL